MVTRTSLSVIKADVRSRGGYLKSSPQLLERTREFVDNNGRCMIEDIYVSRTGDDIALLFSHEKRTGNEDIHKLAWDAFLEGTRIAKGQGLYGAGQDLLKDAGGALWHDIPTVKGRG